MELVLFLAAVGFISLSGVLMPGPVLVAAIVKGSESKHAGAWIALGHLLFEVPLILAIAAGLSFVLDNPWVRIIIGVAGGALLAYMGFEMIMMRGKAEAARKAFPYHPVIAGFVTTVTNPYFLLWWATVGAALILAALSFGPWGILGFVVVHEICDLAWDYFVSYTVFTSKRLWSTSVHTAVFGTCGAMLIIFGIYFILAPWLT